MRTLFINACIHRERSRTLRLAHRYLQHLRQEEGELTLDEVVVEELELPLLGTEGVAHRQRLLDAGKMDDPMFDLARQFAAADRIVVAAPYWDLSFPALLKAYLEQVCVSGLAFRYEDGGALVGLCRADRLVYLTTSGGPIGGLNFGHDYLKGLCAMVGIPDTVCYAAEGLDIWGNDPIALVDGVCF